PRAGARPGTRDARELVRAADVCGPVGRRRRLAAGRRGGGPMRDRVAVVASATFREAVRDRVLFIVLAFAAALILGSRVLGWLSIEDELKMIQDWSLSGMSLLVLLLAMLVGAGSIAREVARRTVYT